MFDLVLTERAIKKVKSLMPQDENQKPVFLRVYIAGGGCGGFKYGMTFDNKLDVLNDFQLEKDGVKIVVDRESAAYLEGTMIDYVDSLQGSGFTFNNPNAKSTCSCGQSFSA
jgi:iron-sulfur cluster assembly accessory protein